LRSAQSEGVVEKDVTPTMRDGRLVIPVAPSNKRKIRGIVHDESATGKTLYIEPAEVVDANNRIRELEGEERQEIIRILSEVAAYIRPLLPDLAEAYDFLGEIDFIRAKAKFALKVEASVPKVDAEAHVTDWVQAYHPLLALRFRAEHKAEALVPLDIRLDDAEQRIILISGPNAGGKSVCLETLGLLQYMLQCGLPIPVRQNSVCTLYDHIFIDIGDEQSIENDLSTYSSHLTNMKFFVRNAGRRTLLLIDEFGSGTEPQIGGAIAQALLAKFNAAGAHGVITTHFPNLKQFAEETPGIVNGAMLYDRHEMRPLFKLETGRPGSSFAIEIAHKIGLPTEVIEEAKRIVGSDYVNMDKYLQDLMRDKRYWEQKRQKIHAQEKRLEEQSAALEKQLAEVKAKRQELMQQARDEAAQLLRDSNAKIENTIRKIKEAQAEKEATRAVRAELTDFRDKIETQQKAAVAHKNHPKKSGATKTDKAEAKEEVFQAGDRVRLKGQLTTGEVMSTNGRECVVAFGMIKSTVTADRLERVSKSQLKREQQQANLTGGMRSPAVSDEIRERRLHFKQEIDVRGMRGEEALMAVTYYMDDAILLGVGEVRILHGTGTGALRQLIRQYLSTLPGVRSYHDEHVQFGGAGITVVELE
jgi:DNA mismatch repair protein MutS2